MLHFPPWKVYLVLGVCALGLVFAGPNLLSRETAESIPTWLPHKQISLGLDLQGGSHLLLEVEAAAVVKERLTALVDETRVALRKARIGYTGLGVSGNAVGVRIRNAADVETARALLADIDNDVTATAAEDGAITLVLGEAALNAMREAAITQSLEIVRRRIDETGTREPTIQRQGSERILV
ncbi:MAG: protein translocase subunit SecD, partial [Alphaproteobacteria bacterium]